MKNDIILINTTKKYALHVDKLIERSKIEIFTWFNSSSSDCKVKVFIYHDIPSLVEGLKKRGFSNYPDYMCACMIDEDLNNNISRSINIIEPTSDVFTLKEYDNIIYHELIHYITNYLFGKLPEWLTEGIAKYLDHSYKEDLTNLMLNYINNYEIPDIQQMCDLNFVKKEEGRTIYDGYDLSYLMIRYIIEIYGKDFLLTLMQENNLSSFDTQKCLTEAIDYFNSVYNEQKDYKKT